MRTRQHDPTITRTRIIAAVTGLALIAAACGDSEPEQATEEPAPVTTVTQDDTTEPVEEPESVFDLDILTPDTPEVTTSDNATDPLEETPTPDTTPPVTSSTLPSVAETPDEPTQEPVSAQGWTPDIAPLPIDVTDPTHEQAPPDRGEWRRTIWYDKYRTPLRAVTLNGVETRPPDTGESDPAPFVEVRCEGTRSASPNIGVLFVWPTEQARWWHEGSHIKGFYMDETDNFSYLTFNVGSYFERFAPEGVNISADDPLSDRFDVSEMTFLAAGGNESFLLTMMRGEPLRVSVIGDTWETSNPFVEAEFDMTGLGAHMAWLFEVGCALDRDLMLGNNSHLEMLDQLRVTVEADDLPFDRSSFGEYVEVGSNGCVSADETLRLRSLLGESSHCAGGDIWRDDLTLAQIDGRGSVDVAHHVDLVEAWQSGLWLRTPEGKSGYLNDVESMIVVSGENDPARPAGADPADWMPATLTENHDHACNYARRWVEVKTRWFLTVDHAEHGALSEMLIGCYDLDVAEQQALISSETDTDRLCHEDYYPCLRSDLAPDPVACDWIASNEITAVWLYDTSVDPWGLDVDGFGSVVAGDGVACHDPNLPAPPPPFQMG